MLQKNKVTFHTPNAVLTNRKDELCVTSEENICGSIANAD